MKFLLLFTLLVSQFALADIYSYRLVDDEDGTNYDIRIELSLSGKFGKNSKLDSLKMFGDKHGKSVLLFSLDKKAVKKFINYKWVGLNMLELGTRLEIKSWVKERYYPDRSDTDIDSSSSYRINSIRIREAGSVKGEYFFMYDQDAEEMTLTGHLKRI